MRGVLLAAAVLAITIAAPQYQFSQKSYVGLEQALAGRIPVGVYSARRIYHAYEDNDNNVVVLNFPGLSKDSQPAAAAAAPTIPGSVAGKGVPLARTRTSPAADVSEAAEEALEDLTDALAGTAAVRSQPLQEEVIEALADAVEDAAPQARRGPPTALRTLVVDLDDLFDSAEDATRESFETAAEIAAEAAEDAAEAAEEAAEDAAEAAEDAAEDAAEAAIAAALGIRTLSLEDDTLEDVSDALEDAAEDAAEAAEDAREAIEDAAEDAAEAEAAAALRSSGVPAAIAAEVADELIRKKRQDDDDEEGSIFDISTADRVSFALSGLGTILGINLGRWLDTTHEANVELIDGMERVGNVVLNQVDGILERAAEPNRTKADKSSLF